MVMYSINGKLLCVFFVLIFCLMVGGQTTNGPSPTIDNISNDRATPPTADENFPYSANDSMLAGEVSAAAEPINRIDMRLRNLLLPASSTERVPVKNVNRPDKPFPITVSVGIEMKKIIEVKEVEQKFTIQVWLRLSWKNEFLKWKPEKWENITWIKVKPSQVWAPDVVPYNDMDDKETEITDKYRKLIKVLPTGMNYWYIPVVFVLACDIKVQYFPFDVQRCPVTFGSWEYNSHSLLLSKDSNSIITSDYKSSSEWNILYVETKNELIKYPCCETPYSVATFTFVIHRRALYFIYNVILPCTALMIVILMSFFLPPDSGERIAVVITVLLALCLFLQFISTSLPKNSDATSVLSIFYTAIFVECTFSLVTTCIVLVMHHRGTEPWETPVPKWIRTIFLRYFLKENKEHENADDNIVSDTVPNGGSDMYKDNGNQCMEDEHLLPGKPYPHSRLNKLKSVDGQLFRGGHSDYLLCGILNELKLLSSEVVERKQAEQNEREWRYISKCLDWVFFILFMCLFIFTSVLILVPAYLEHTKHDH